MTAEFLTESKPSTPQLRSPTETKIPVQPRPREVTKTGLAKVDIFLVSCGIAAPLLYVFTDVLLAMRWDGYSYRDQTISELNAIGSPTRTLSIILGIIGYAFVTAFGVGVWRSAATNRRLRVAACGLVTLGVLGSFGVPFFPMHVREAEETLTDTLHVAQLAIAGPLLLVIIGFGAAAFGWWFRLYSGATVLVALAFGMWAGRYGADLANDLVTPWVGIIERISVFAYQLWLVVFAIALLGLAHDGPAQSHELLKPSHGYKSRSRRWMFAHGRPNAVARVLNAATVALAGAGMAPRRLVVIEVPGRRTGRMRALPVVLADYGGERYLVSMLGPEQDWVRNVRAAGGRAVLRHRRRESVHLEELAPDDRAPILRRYLQLASGARAHIALSTNAPLSEFEQIADQHVVFRVSAEPVEHR